MYVHMYVCIYLILTLIKNWNNTLCSKKQKQKKKEKNHAW